MVFIRLFMIYCLSCKKKTPDNNLTSKITKNKRPYVQSNCSNCRKSKSQFASISKIQGDGVLSNSFKNIPILNKIF